MKLIYWYCNGIYFCGACEREFEPMYINQIYCPECIQKIIEGVRSGIEEGEPERLDIERVMGLFLEELKNEESTR